MTKDGELYSNKDSSSGLRTHTFQYLRTLQFPCTVLEYLTNHNDSIIVPLIHPSSIEYSGLPRQGPKGWCGYKRVIGWRPSADVVLLAASDVG
jgi:hypothetical protein